MFRYYSDFTGRLLREIYGRRGKENIAISPYSVMNLLAIAAQASAGSTRDEIVGALLPQGTYDELVNSISCLRRVLFGKGFRSSNAVIMKEKITNSIVKDCEELLNKVFEAELLVCDDIDIIANEWVYENTGGHITHVINYDPDALVCMINAILFQADWKIGYGKSDIKENRTFTNMDGSISTVTMLSSYEYCVVENKYFTGFCKPYKNGFSYMVLLPVEEGQSFLIQALRDTDLGNVFHDRYSDGVYVNMPEFSSDFNLDLAQVCCKMGIKTLFTDRADLSGMCCSELKLGSITHAATIEVDRYGTRLAAVSSSFYVTGTFQNHEDRKVIVDRPFVYAIMHDESELPVVVGNVNRLPDSKNKCSGRN